MDRRKIIDAEYEIVRPAHGRGAPWWKRLYVAAPGAIIALGIAAIGLARVLTQTTSP